jgi:hypothetical protein
VPAGTLRRAALRHLLHHPTRPEPPHVTSLCLSVSAFTARLGSIPRRGDGDRIHFPPALASAAGGCTGSSRR